MYSYRATEIHLQQISKMIQKLNCYYELIHYSGNRLEPRLTMDMSSEALLSIKVEEYPCHNQAVERVIRIVSETASHLACPLNRDAQISTNIDNRKKTKKCNTKCEFNY